MDLLPGIPGIIDSGRSNGTEASANIWATVKGALSWAASPVYAPVSAVNNIGAGLATGAKKAGEGVAAVGSSIKSAVTSFSSGIKWGVAILIILIAGFYLMPIFSALIASRRN